MTDENGMAVLAHDLELSGSVRYGGSAYEDANLVIAKQALRSVWRGGAGEECRERLDRATFITLAEIAPRDVIEGQIAAQMVACHNAAMECFRRAMLESQTFEGRSENLSQANRLSRTYAALVETLNRHRGKGQQKVTVEHVHVHAGGQAVVGVVEGGGVPTVEGQPHAKQLGHASVPSVLSTVEEDGETVSRSRRSRL